MGNTERQVPDKASAWQCSYEMTPRDAANMSRFGAWLIAWTFTFAFATVVLAKPLIASFPLNLALAIVPTLLGITAVRAYLKFFHEADELLRKIQVESLAWGFGAGVVFMMGYRLLERIGAPKLDVSDPLIVMGIAAAIGQLVARRRYL